MNLIIDTKDVYNQSIQSTMMKYRSIQTLKLYKNDYINLKKGKKMSNEYYLNEHNCEEGCPCVLIRSGWKDDKGDWKESVFAFKEANKTEFVPHSFFIDEAGHYDVEEDKKHLDSAMFKVFCVDNNNISIEQINEWNAKPNSQKKYFAGNGARAMDCFKFVPRTNNLDINIDDLFDDL